METLKLTEVELYQSLNKKGGGDYSQVKRRTEDGVDYEVHAYGNPRSGYWGYQVIFHEQREDGEYVKSIGYGEEAESRTRDWTKLLKD